MQQFKRNQQHSKQPTTYTATQVHSSAWTQLGKENAGAAVLVKGQIDQDRKDRRAIQKVQGPVSAAGTAPHKGSVRGRGTYGSPAFRGLGAVAGISPSCECLNLFVFFVRF